METVRWLFDLFLHLDKHVKDVVATCGWWTYLLLFVVVFCETGLVVTPFLPGDSLLFAAGTAAGLGMMPMNPHALFLVLAVAAVLGDTVNYWIGAFIGPRAFTGHYRFFKKEHLDRTHRFFEKYGGKTIILARFVPIVRTFAPFVAGIGAMNYRRFIAYNVIGGVAWVALFVYAGYFFASVTIVQENFSLVVLAIIVLSVLPIVYEYWKVRQERSQAAPAEATEE
jgi:membrane-associated protein